ncbi:histidine kinase N-terminal 7TM domain-containing protein [Natronocalculus amylovorans]|uniref:histidine kinase n=1 Tax=Natronocalculus amylovorans TaxID=2917812 RepID=A0AAE3FZH7_9EURY|nr:histidine kinase N-terminal 7TM domain-containing protein [Natronocalculus amylovorans]MCL9817504.1 ATP-binding protein [Natronocalculus amylovorans]
MYVAGMIAYAGSALIGSLLAIALLVKYDRRQPSFTFGLFLLVIGFWAATYVGYLIASTEQWLLFFIQLSYLSVVSAPIVWVVFAIQYTDREAWLSRQRIVLLSVVPAVVLALVWTAPFHSLFYADTLVTTINGVVLLDTPPAVGHRINIIYAYGLLLIGSALIVAEIFTKNQLYRRQSLVLLACLSAPWVANAVFHLGMQPIPTADLTPVVFVLTGIPLAILVQRSELTGFVPIAHERVFHTLEDPVFVISSSNRILDANRAAHTLFDADFPTRSLEGSDITDVLPQTLLSAGGLHPKLETAMECVITINGTSRQYIARVRRVYPNRKTQHGSIVSLTDITLQKRQQESVNAKNEQLERLASVISHDLSTPLATGESLLHLIKSDLDSPQAEVKQSIDDLETVHRRLRVFAEGLPTLARESTDVETPTNCDLECIARNAWEVVDTDDLTLSIDSTAQLWADASRLQQAFENLFTNVAEHGTTNNRTESDNNNRQPSATTVRIGQLSTGSGFYIEDNGPGIPVDRREDMLEFGVSTGSGSGYGLAIVRTIIEAHGWSLSITEGTTGGARFEIEIDPHVE